MTPLIIRASCWLTLLVLASCGAGIVTGVVAGSDGESRPAPVAPLEPSVTLPVDEGPLYIAVGETYEAAAVLANIDIPSGVEVVVEFALPADGASAELVERQSNVVISGVSTIRWQLETAQIRARFADLTAQDVDVDVRIGVQRETGVEVLGTSRFTLLRRRVASFDPTSNRTVSVVGGPVTVRVKPTVGPDIVVEVRTASGRTLPAAVRGRHTDGDESVLSLDLPAGETPEELSVTVVDAVAGRSTEVGGAFYGPELFAVVDRSGRTTGDETISLIGAGLIPVVIDAGTGEPRLDFDRVEVSFERGGQSAIVDSTQFVQSSSTPNALTLRSPASPDGREGTATVIVRVVVDDSSGGQTVVSDREDEVFAYAASNPQFEPRGIALGVRPEGIDLGQLTGGADDVSDVAALYLNTIDFTGLVRVYQGVGNGMLRVHGAVVSTSEPGVAQLLLPVDVAVGDFAGDALDDVMVANLGFGAVPLTSLLENDLGRPGLLAGYEPGLVVVEPLVREAHRVSLVAPGQDDFLIVARQGAAYATRPALLPRWLRDVWPSVFATGNYTVVAPIDHNDDGLDEVVTVIRTEPTLRWRVALLRGVDGAPNATSGPFDVTDRFADFEPRFVLDVSQSAELALAFVLEPLNGDTDPWRIDIMRPAGSELTLLDTFSIPGDFDVGAAASVSIGDDHGFVIALGSALQGGLTTFRRTTDGNYEFLARTDRFDYELVGPVLDMAIGRLDAGQDALFVLHEPPTFGGNREVRLSTLLVDPSGKLLGPRGLRELPAAPIDITAVGADRDIIAVSHANSLNWLESDPFGSLRVMVEQPLSSAPVAGALLRVPLDDGDRVAFVDAAGFVWLGSATAPPQRSPSSIDLTTFGPGEILSVLDASVGDVDGDGRDDIVLLVRYGLVGGDAFECVVQLAGVDAAFPFESPTTRRIRHVPGAESLSIGNFALDGAGPPQLEIGVAVPAEGIRFLRSVAGELEYREIPSSTTNAFALDGREPSIVRSVDFDGDGVDGLAVLSSARGQALFYAQKTPMVGAVPADGFELIDSRVVTPGQARDMRVADVDGDLIPDFLIYLRDLLRRPSIAVMLWDGTDRVHSAFTLDWNRVGTTPPAVRDVHAATFLDRRFAWTLADTNHDGLSDLVLTFEEGRNTYEVDQAGDIVPVDQVRRSAIHTLFGSRR